MAVSTKITYGFYASLNLATISYRYIAVTSTNYYLLWKAKEKQNYLLLCETCISLMKLLHEIANF